MPRRQVGPETIGGGISSSEEYSRRVGGGVEADLSNVQTLRAPVLLGATGGVVIDSSSGSSADQSARWRTMASSEGDESSSTRNRIIYQLFSPNNRTSIGRKIQLAHVLMVASVCCGGLFAQIDTDVENANERNAELATIVGPMQRVLQFNQIHAAILAEMEPFLIYSHNTYDVLAANGGTVQQGITDNVLLYATNWPASDLVYLDADLRSNYSSPAAIESALRSVRNYVKNNNGNGTDPNDLANFYDNDNMKNIARGIIGSMARFSGYKDLLAYDNIFNVIMSTSGSMAYGEYCIENHISDWNDAIYQQYASNYAEIQPTGFLFSGTLTSSFTADKAKNLTDLDTTKAFFEAVDKINNLDYSGLTMESWKALCKTYMTNVQWIADQLWARCLEAAYYNAGVWPQQQLVSVGLLVASLVTGLASVILQIIGCIRLHREIVRRTKHADMLDRAMNLLYDCVPRSFVGLARSGEVSGPRRCQDTCILMMDIVNIASLMTDFEPQAFLDVITAFYENFEEIVAKYNCFKVEIVGNDIVLGAGVGEPHSVDHVAEMIYLALELQDAMISVAAINEKTDTQEPLQLRVGVHVGNCIAKLLALSLPRMSVFGEVMETAALVHATGLPLKVHASSIVRERLVNCTEIEFLRRGHIMVEGKSRNVSTYWVSWMTDAGDVDEASKASTTSSKGSQQGRQTAKRQAAAAVAVRNED